MVDVSAIVDRVVWDRLRLSAWGQVCDEADPVVRATVKGRVWARWGQVESVVRFQFLRDFNNSLTLRRYQLVEFGYI
jgi:hypothetical protein